MSITSAQVLKVDKSITLPLATDAVKKDNTRSEAIVNVRWDDAGKKATYVMDDRVMPTMVDVTKALVEAKKKRRCEGDQGAQSDVSLRDPRRSHGIRQRADRRDERRCRGGDQRCVDFRLEPRLKADETPGPV